MDSNIKFSTRDDGIPEQTFNGKTYRLYTGETYFSRGRKRLHIELWKYFNGEIPRSFDIHHKDGNTFNNAIENLEIIQSKIHQKEHGKKRAVKFPEWVIDFQTKGIEAAKVWHKSKAGREWHKQHAAKINFGNITYGNKICEVCNSDFIANTKHQRFCSNRCKSQYRRNNKADYITATCEYCGEQFTHSKYSKQRYCSKSCGAKSRIKVC